MARYTFALLIVFTIFFAINGNNPNKANEPKSLKLTIPLSESI